MSVERRRIYLDVYHGHFTCLVEPIWRRFNSRIFLGAIKALTSQLLNSKNKIPVIDV